MPYAALEEVWGNNYKNSNSHSNRKKKKPKKINNTVNDKELEQYYNNLEINEQLEEFQNFQNQLQIMFQKKLIMIILRADYNQE